MGNMCAAAVNYSRTRALIDDIEHRQKSTKAIKFSGYTRRKMDGRLGWRERPACLTLTSTQVRPRHDFGTFLRSAAVRGSVAYEQNYASRFKTRCRVCIIQDLVRRESKDGIHSISDPREDDFLNVSDPREYI